MDASHDDAGRGQHGLLFALGAYAMWGFFPIYWKQLRHIAALEILAHRMVWSLVLMVVVILLSRRLTPTLALFRNRRLVLSYLLAATFLAINWGTYIWAVNHGFVVETALGYFINPLINVLFGALFLGERARKFQWAAIALAACGVLYLTLAYGQPPIVALTLAVTFATYGLIKKKNPLGALDAMSLETTLLFPAALAYLIFLAVTGESSWGAADAQSQLLLMGSGLATVLPLLCFAAAVRRLTLTLLGIVQYLAPTIQFLIGIFLYHETFDQVRFIGFLMIWAGVILYTLESVWRMHRTRRAQARVVHP